ncbi:TetR/AcrR family transcriptional regulator [Pseudomonas sp. NFX224]|uniref:TetR/AcrR family transcriptional regulator n=1 Tax=Pseudomonas sp. NFX224 TaxID=3402862 RepID=UPI003AFA780D
MTLSGSKQEGQSAAAASSAAKAPARGRPTAEVSNEQLARLIHIAFRHFLEFGPDRASVQAIAAEAGLTRQSIYARFGSKAGFVASVVGSRGAEFFGQFSIELERDERAPAVVLTEYAIAVVDQLLLEERITMARALFAGLHRYPELRKAERATYLATFAMLATYFERVAAREGLALADSLFVARNFTAQLTGFQLPLVLGTGTLPSPTKRAQQIRRIVSMTLRGIGLKD